MSGLHFEKGEKPPDILKKLTKPLTNLVIQINKKVITSPERDFFLRIT